MTRRPNQARPFRQGFQMTLVRRMRGWTLILLASPLLALGKEPTQQDYDIWAATLAPHVAHGLTYVWHRIEPTSVFARGTEKGALERHPEFRAAVSAWSNEAAEIDIERLNAAIKATEGIGSPQPARLLDQEMLEKILGRKPRPAWIVSPRLVDGVDSIVRLSGPAVREDGRAAYIICGEFTIWKGSICHNIIDKKPDGRWWPGETAMRDLLLWGPGWPGESDQRLFIDD